MTHARTSNRQSPAAHPKVQQLMADEKQDQERIRTRERQQAAIADLGQRALGGIDLQTLMDETVAMLANTLDVESTKILELLPSGDAFLLRAGVGWKEGLVGKATVSAGGTGKESQAGYTLLTRKPVVVEDLREEDRFSFPPLLVEHGIISGISVVIEGGTRPYGILGVHSIRRREFTVDDVHFLQAISNILGAVIQRAQMEDELRSSRDQLRAILEGVADGITVQDGSGALIFANDEAARIVGCASAEELLRTPISDVLNRFEMRDEHGFPISPSLLPGRRALEGEESPEIVIQFRAIATGEQRWSIVKARAVLDEHGKPEMAINIFRDITDRKRAEQAQRFLADASSVLASSLEYETTLSRVASLAVPQIADWCAVHLVDDHDKLAQLVVAHVDPAKVELAKEFQLRYPPNMEATGGIAEVLRTGRPQLYPDVPDYLLEAAAQDEEHLHAMRDLGMKSIMVVPMVARGRTLGVITIVSAESMRRYGAEDLALAQHLARRAALAVDNARLYREAQEAIRVRNELFSSVSHDLKNPLTGIKGMAQLLRRQIGRINVAGKDRLLEGLTSIDATATRMTSQIDELLDIARLQTGQSPTLRRHTTDLVSLVSDAVSEHQLRTDRHRIVVRSEVDHLLGNWDGLRIRRVVSNLLANSIKYSPSGGEIEVTVRAEQLEGSQWAILSVRDHGVGIPHADVERVFEGFHRGGNVEGKIAGTGLGLASARQIVELHGGHIEVASQEGAGSTFTVYLPLDVEAKYGRAA